MSARDWFESIRADVLDVVELEREIESECASAGPHGQSGSIGGGGSHDSMRGIDRIVDNQMRERLQHMKERTNARIERASQVLYGKSDRGGLAAAKGSTDAAILCCYYLQAMEWTEIPAAIGRQDVKRPNGWCRQRAMRALEYIDRVGTKTLAES